MFDAGQDVFVEFDGEEYPGEVLNCNHGWVTARVLIDPLCDHGDVLTPMLGVMSVVNVREGKVRIVEDA